MRAVGIKALKDKLSEYVRRAADGEVVLITDRDRVVAELRAPSAGRSERLADVALASLVAKGLIRPPLDRSPEPPPHYERRVSTSTLLNELDADRSER